jgi:fatty-acyl-CoA synthase|tara:strand:+ start:2286 stop:3911 length:1626 start_codon:yes stop_codon:yes gene_type:complete
MYNNDLEQNPANHQPLSPLPFLERAASVFPDHVAIIYGDVRISYAEFYARCRRFASVLAGRGIGRGDTVSVMLANTPTMLEAHYAVPMCGAVLHSMNTRLDATNIAFQLDHGESKVLITDTGFSTTIEEALTLAKVKPWVIDYEDLVVPQPGKRLGGEDYDALVDSGDANYEWMMPLDEWDAIALNYTSGTTGDPKGVVYHHRGACLISQGNAITANIPKHPVYLWTLPMFHCNGWCFPWTLSALTGTHVCLREVRADAIWAALDDHNVTHLCGAPVVMSTILAADPADKRTLASSIDFFTAAAPPPESVLSAMGQAGFNVTHLYGLTEVYGPAVVNDWHAEWSDLPAAEQASLKARQGVRYHALEGLDVLDPDTMQPVPRDGETLGEVMFRGNVVMKGYLKNPRANNEAFAGGWFHSGDLGVVDTDGYIQLKDRSKDIIISGGENISSIEIEEVLHKHAEVVSAAVVAMPHAKWGETPCAFVELADNAVLTADDLTGWCKQHLASFKVPKRFVFQAIVKTSTGKVQKFPLRQQASALAAE